MSELEASEVGVGEPPPPYMIFVVVFLFFITGLFGFLVCHLLKKKGYRCRTGDMEDEEEEEKLGGGADDEDDENQDTVEQILKCIIENEANMEAFNEMLGNRNVCVRHDARLRKESIGGIPPHHHTVHSGMDHNSCHLCAQSRSKKGRRQSRTPRFKQKPGEQTVFSVGRFRVIHTDKKPQSGPNPMAVSGDQLNQSQDSEEQKEGGYNLRSMFKDVRPPSESANGVAGNAGKRRKSLTFFGLRRGSDPAGTKAAEGTGGETGGLRNVLQQQPMVLEEPTQTQNIGGDAERSTAPGSKPTDTPKNQKTASPERKALGSIGSLSSQGPEEGARLKPGPESGIKVISRASNASAATPAPSSLPIPSNNRIDLEDPGPLQTSTPISPLPGSIPGPTPATAHESFSSTGFPVTQTPPDQGATPNLEPGANLVLISLGSSPPSSFQSQTLSSVSSLKSPTSDLAVTPSPRLSSRKTPSDSATTALTPSPKLSSREMSNKLPISSSAFTTPLEAQSPSPGPSASPAPASLSTKEQEGVTNPKTERKRAGILKTSKPSTLVSPSGDLQGSTFSSPSDHPSKDRPSALSSPQGSNISSVSIVKPSPDSGRQFSVVTMVEEGESFTKVDKSETSELKNEPEPEPAGSSVFQLGEDLVSGVGEPEGESVKSSGGESQAVISQEKDDMVEMEDIRDCKVTEVVGAESTKEEEEKMVKTQPKQV